jgi:hypothetical protein
MKLRIEGVYLNIIKAIQNKPVANIILNGEKLKAFPLRSGVRQKCLLSLLLFWLGIANQSNKIGRRNKRNANWKGNSLSLFADDMTLYLKDLHQKPPRQNK